MISDNKKIGHGSLGSANGRGRGGHFVRKCAHKFSENMCISKELHFSESPSKSDGNGASQSSGWRECNWDSAKCYLCNKAVSGKEAYIAHLAQQHEKSNCRCQLPTLWTQVHGLLGGKVAEVELCGVFEQAVQEVRPVGEMVRLTGQSA